MGKYSDMLDDDEQEMSRDDLNEAMVELAEDIFGKEAADQLRNKLGAIPN
jgi:hypothetical protein